MNIKISGDSSCTVREAVNIIASAPYTVADLAIMAFNVLSIPLMSAEYEHVFSAAGYLIIGRRNAMKEDIINVTTYLRAWQSVD